MKDNVFNYTKDFIDEIQNIYLDDIRGSNFSAFTRNRKVSVFPLMLQMFNQKGKTQLSEIIDLYENLGEPLNISTVGFYKARMKFNPFAIKLMSKDFISDIYDKENESMVKLNGYIVTAIDGSDINVPTTKENVEIYGRASGNPKNDVNNYPTMAKLSLIYDCINNCVFDSEVGEYKHSERDFALAHIEALKTMLKEKTITIFDRGYFSIKLVDKMVENNQKFLFRLKKSDLKKYSNQVQLKEDKTFNITYDRNNTNDYREDKKLRNKIINTTYKLRIVKVPITSSETQETYEEILLTNLKEDEFDLNALKELYRLRWRVETVYNTLKNKMKIEEFSGKRSTIILQDIFSCIWLNNIIILRIIEINEENEIPDNRYKYKMKHNVNVAIGLVKSCFVRSIIRIDKDEATRYFEECTNMINKHLVPIRMGRNFKRGNTKNKSRMSYRYSY